MCPKCTSEVVSLEHKAFTLADLKVDLSSGQFTGYAAAFGNRDAGGDIIAPGAFSTALPAFLRDGFISWGHDWTEPVAMPTAAREDDFGLHLTGVFHSTPEAQRARTIAAERLAAGKRLGLSIGYRVEKQEVSPAGRTLLVIDPLYEVGLVAVPMNREANLTAVKGAKAALSPHTTPTSEAAWDGPANEARLPSRRDALRAAFAWVDPAGDPDTKAAYRFIHHEVSEGGDPGAASLLACSSGIGILNGARGGTTIPEADHPAVWRHLAHHLRDGDREPPELRGLTPAGGADAVTALVGEILAAERKEGRILSAASRGRLMGLAAAMRGALDDLEALLAETEPKGDRTRREIEILIEQARFLGIPINRH